MSYFHKCKCCSQKKKCHHGSKKLPKRVYAHLFYSATEPQFVRVFPDAQFRNVVEFNQSPITKGITHPANGDLSKFRVDCDGVYKVSWILNTVATSGESYFLSQGGFTLQINEVFRVERPQHLAGFTFISNSPADVVRPQFTGQDLLKLKSGDVVQLLFFKGFVDTSVPDDGLQLELTQNFADIDPVFNCIAADLIIERIDS